MMKRTVMLCFLAQVCLGGWNTNWPASSNTTYQLFLGRDILTNTLQRAWAAEGTRDWFNYYVTCSVPVWTNRREVVTNLVFPGTLIVTNGVTNAYSLIVTQRLEQYGTNTYTNALGPNLVQGNTTGGVFFTAAYAETWDTLLEAHIPRYTLPVYSLGYPSWVFDDWFTNVVSGTRVEDFPAASKADLFQHYGIGIVSNINNYVVSIGGQSVTNYSGRGRWTKRRNRPFWWRSYEVFINTAATGTVTIMPIPESDGQGDVIQKYPRLKGNDYTLEPFVSEFYAEYGEARSYLETIPSNPSWVFRAPTTNGTFSASFSSVGAAVWTNYAVSGIQSVPSLILTPGTQVADRAYMLWVPSYNNTFEFQWSASTNTGRGSSIALVWTNNLTVYEGSNRWDSVLYPEALEERRTALTNLFLTPWTGWQWTNTLVCTNFSYYTNRTDLPTNVVYATNCTCSDYEGPCTNGPVMDWPPTNQIHTWPAANLSDWWLTTSALDIIPRNVVPAIIPTLCEGVATNAQAPRFTYSGSSRLYVDCVVYGLHDWLDEYDNECQRRAYERSGGRTATGYVSIAGTNWTSAAIVTNLWTGALHRVHFYARRAAQNAGNQPYHLFEVSDWTSNTTVTSTSRFDCAAIFPGETNAALSVEHAQGPWGVDGCETLVNTSSVLQAEMWLHPCMESNSVVTNVTWVNALGVTTNSSIFAWALRVSNYTNSESSALGDYMFNEDVAWTNGLGWYWVGTDFIVDSGDPVNRWYGKDSGSPPNMWTWQARPTNVVTNAVIVDSGYNYSLTNCLLTNYVSYTTNVTTTIHYVEDTNSWVLVPYWTNVAWQYYICDLAPSLTVTRTTGTVNWGSASCITTNTATTNTYADTYKCVTCTEPTNSFGNTNGYWCRSNMFVAVTQYSNTLTLIDGETVLIVTALTNTVPTDAVGIYQGHVNGKGGKIEQQTDGSWWLYNDAFDFLYHFDSGGPGSPFPPFPIIGVNNSDKPCVRLTQAFSTVNVGTRYGWEAQPPVAGSTATNWWWENRIDQTWATNDTLTIDMKVLVEWDFR